MLWIWCGAWWSVCVRVSLLHVWGSALDDSTRHLSTCNPRRCILSYLWNQCANYDFSALWRAAKSQSVRLCLNKINYMETWREEHTNTLSVRYAPFLSGFTVSEWLRHGIPHRSGLLLGLHRSNSFHFSPPSLHLPPVQTHFIYLPCLIVRQGEHAWLPRCPGSEMWRADKRASVDRHLLCLDRGLGGCHGLGVSWSHGRLAVNVSWWYCVGGMLGSIVNTEYALSHMCLTKQTRKRKEHFYVSMDFGMRSWKDS